MNTTGRRGGAHLHSSGPRRPRSLLTRRSAPVAREFFAIFLLGNDEMPFGEYLQRLEGPTLADGYLPIVQLKFRHGDGTYSQETFASTAEPYASNAVVLTRFTYHLGADPERPGNGRMVVRLDSKENVRTNAGTLVNQKGEVL